MQIALHWGVAVMIVFQLLAGGGMSQLWRQIRQGGSATTTTAAWIHIIVGTLVLVLVLWRLFLRLTRGVPDAPEGESRALKLAGDAGHWLLYGLMIAMPATGLLAWYGGVTAVAGLHSELLKTLLWVTIAGHVLAAFYHHFVRKDGLIRRMMRAG